MIGGTESKIKKDPKYLPLIIKFQIDNPKPADKVNKSNIDIFLEGFSTAIANSEFEKNVDYSDNPDVYFMLRIDGVASAFIEPTIHYDCLGRPVNQSIMYDSKFKGRRAIIEFWNSNDDSLINKIGGIIGSINAELEGNVGAASAAATIDGKQIGEQLKACSTYLGQCEIVLGNTVGEISAITDGSTIKKDITVEIVQHF